MFEVKIYMVAANEYKTLARFYSMEGALEYTLTIDSAVEIERKGEKLGRYFKGKDA